MFTAPQFVLSVTVFLTGWFLLPSKFRKIALLLFSYYFVWSLGGSLTLIILILITLLSYGIGLLIENSAHGKALVLGFTGLLVSFLSYVKFGKYLTLPGLGTGSGNEAGVLSFTGIVGVSYFVFSVISYITDIYWGKDTADRNIIDAALWLSFFPKFTAGPIERHAQFKDQLNRLEQSKFNMERLKRGFLICSLGYFYKMIIADRMSLFVNTVYENLSGTSGFVLVIAMILYSFQIYFDFAGYSLIAYGLSFIIDLKISKNFEHPYFSRSLSEFWRRWHISLSSWLRDYVYIPLGGSRKGQLRQKLNLMLTFLVSGIWHGTGWTFIIWGLLHGLGQIVEKPLRKIVKIPEAVQTFITFFYVSGCWIFFRAGSVRSALVFIRRMLILNPKGLSNGTLLSLGLDWMDWTVLLVSLSLGLAIELIQYKGISIYEGIQKQHIVVRWCFYYAVIVVLVVFGMYGPAYDSQNFIYFQF